MSRELWIRFGRNFAISFALAMLGTLFLTVLWGGDGQPADIQQEPSDYVILIEAPIDE